MCRGRLLSIALLLCLLALTVPLHGSALDSGLVTTYNAQSPFTNVNFSVCGQLPQSEGCYGGGILGPFGMMGAIIEGNPVQSLKNGTVTRYIYVLDVAYGSSGNEVALYVYKRIDTITPTDDTISLSLFKTVVLPLNGGSGTVAYMAANKGFLLIGTSQNGIVAEVNKKNLAVTQFGGTEPGTPPVSAIMADQYGYVVISWGSGNFSLYLEINPNGQAGGDGGGTAFTVNTIQATLPAVMPQ